MTNTVDAERDESALVGERIHMLMWRKRINQTQLGQAIGVGQATAGKKVRGLVPITVPELMAIARLLDVEPGDLLPPRGDVLPRLDSNQQPSGYLSDQVRAGAAGVAQRGTAPILELPAGVVDLAQRRARKAS